MKVGRAVAPPTVWGTPAVPRCLLIVGLTSFLYLSLLFIIRYHMMQTMMTIFYNRILNSGLVIIVTGMSHDPSDYRDDYNSSRFPRQVLQLLASRYAVQYNLRRLSLAPSLDRNIIKPRGAAWQVLHKSQRTGGV